MRTENGRDENAERLCSVLINFDSTYVLAVRVRV